MLPLTPPANADQPAYPSRAGLLADPALRRRALAVLAAATLAGCAGNSQPTQPRTAGVPRMPAAPAPAPGTMAEPQRLGGDIAGPQVPEAQSLGGKPAPPQAPPPVKP